MGTLLFNTVMGCWSHSNSEGSYRKTRGILDRQINLFTSLNGKAGSDDCRPDVYGYTRVLSSCASETGDEAAKAKAFNVALSTYQQLKVHKDEYGSPNHVTYRTMLKCVAKLPPQDSHKRKKWTKKIFNQAIANGCVGDNVLKGLQEAATSREEYKELMRGKQKLPASWTRNVDQKSSYNQKASAKRAEV